MAYRNNTKLLARRGFGLFTTTTTTTTRHAVAAIASTNNNAQHDLYNRRSYSSTIAANKEYAPNPLDAFRDPK
jgi:hypothetical protein